MDARSARRRPPDSCLANARICGPVKRSNAREPVLRASADSPPTADSISAHSRLVLESIQTGARGREKTSASSRRERRGGARAGERRQPAFVQVHAAVLLGGTGDRRQVRHGLRLKRREPRHHAIERVHPHQRRRRDDGGIGAAKNAVIRAVRRQFRVVGHGCFKQNLSTAFVDFDQCCGETLGAGVEAEVITHLTTSSPRRRMSFDDAPTMMRKTPGSTIHFMLASSIRSSSGPSVRRHFALFAGRQTDSLEALQLHHRPRNGCEDVANVELRDLVAVTRTRVADLESDGRGAGRGNLRGFEDEVRVLERGVAQAVAEREQAPCP